MRLVCPNDSTHRKFSVVVHVTQEWEVFDDGEHNSTIEECIDVLTKLNEDDFVYTCTKCGAEALTKGEIVTVYATFTDEYEPYLDVFDKEEDAKNEIGKMYNEGKVIEYSKGYSLKPVGGKHLYDDAPDFCYTVEEAIDNAQRLGIKLKNLTPVNI